MAISSSPVQQKAGAGPTNGITTTFTITLDSLPTSGGFLALYYDGAQNIGISSIAQTGATWVKAETSSQNRRAEIWYAENVSATSAAILITLTSAPTTGNSASVSEWSGVLTSGSLDAHSNNNSVSAGSGTALNSGTVTPTAGKNALIITGFRFGGAYSSGPTNGFTALLSSDGSSRGFGSYLVPASTAGSYTTDYGAGNGTWEGCIATFLGPDAAVTKPKNKPNLLLMGVG